MNEYDILPKKEDIASIREDIQKIMLSEGAKFAYEFVVRLIQGIDSEVDSLVKEKKIILSETVDLAKKLQEYEVKSHNVDCRMHSLSRDIDSEVNSLVEEKESILSEVGDTVEKLKENGVEVHIVDYKINGLSREKKDLVGFLGTICKYYDWWFPF